MGSIVDLSSNTNDPTYLNYIQYNGRVLGADDDDYSFNWDDKRPGTKIILSNVLFHNKVFLI